MTTQAEDSKKTKCLEIYKRLHGNRAECMEAFKDIHDSDATCATYYNLCFIKTQAEQDIETDKVRQSKAQKKFSAVKPKRGTQTASHVQMFMTRKAAQLYNDDNFGFNEVVSGEQVVGKKIGTIKRSAA